MSDKWSRFEKYAVLLVLCASVGLNLTMSRRLGRAPVVSTEPNYLGPGEVAPLLKLRDLAGKDVVVDFKTAPTATVLYVMSPSCPWCARNRLNVGALEAATRDRYRWIAVSPQVDGVMEYLEKKPYAFPVFVATSETRSTYRLRTLPETIVIDKSGVVLQNWGGAYSGDEQVGIENFFEFKLPGLLSTAEIKAGR